MTTQTWSSAHRQPNRSSSSTEKRERNVEPKDSKRDKEAQATPSPVGKRPYRKPSIQSSEAFESAALGCGKQIPIPSPPNLS